MLIEENDNPLLLQDDKLPLLLGVNDKLQLQLKEHNDLLLLQRMSCLCSSSSMASCCCCLGRTTSSL